MNEQQLAAVKQALEALEGVVKNCWRDIPSWRLDEIKEHITDLQSIISQDALYKMAEDAVTIGLSYNDWPKIGCVNHDCDKCKAVQEPVGEVYRHGKSSNGTPWHGIKWLDEGVNMPDGTLLYTTPQPVPVKTYHDGKPWPVAPKPWAGLTDEELKYLMAIYSGVTLYRAIETRLKEKNA